MKQPLNLNDRTRRTPSRLGQTPWRSFRQGLRAVAVAVVVLVAGASVGAGEQIRFRDAEDKVREATGEVLVEARDGGVMFLANDGRIWTLQPDDIESRQAIAEDPEPLDHDAMKRRLLAEMPAGFQVYETKHYLICHNTPGPYAVWVGSLFEQLYRGFYAYWKNQGWNLDEPRFPLVALVFADRNSFVRHGHPKLGDAVNNMIGYYNLETNRMNTFDVPNRERNVATIIHEATHQLAYNTGLQQRFADNPMWVSEGLAVFFEAPDFSNPRGWRTIGRVNQVNLRRFQKYLPGRPADSLTSLIGDDRRFRDPEAALAAYSEAWALNYFLLRTKRKAYVRYLQELSQGEPLQVRSARERVAAFEKAMGCDLETLEKSFIPYMMRVRGR